MPTESINSSEKFPSSEKLQDDTNMYFNADERTTISKENSMWESLYDFLGSGEGGNKR